MKITICTITFLLGLTFAQAQSFNQEAISENGKAQLLGKINKQGLETEPYVSWFYKNHAAYSHDQDLINQSKNELSKYTITAFMGTWCGDSKREIPKFYKVLEQANFPLERLTMVAVDRDKSNYKQSPGGEEEGLTIHRVPTFVFYKDGKEVNRIVESPVATFEEDIQQIINGEYTPNYNSVQIVNDAIASLGVEKFTKKSKKLVKQLKPITKNMYELNTYGNVLFFAGKTKEAIAVAKINLLLFPDEGRAKESLENKIQNRMTQTPKP